MSDDKTPGTPGAGDDEPDRTNQPMGFRGKDDTGGPPSGGEPDPLGAMFGGELPPELRQQLEAMGLGQVDPAMLQMVQAQVQAMMSGTDDGSAVNMNVATDAARRAVSEAGDQSISQTTARDVEQVVQVANLWLDQVTDLAPPEGRVRALSRAEWVELSMPVWETLTEPP